LNVSPRNCSLTASRIGNVLKSAQLAIIRFGPRKVRGPTFPNVYGAGYLNAATLNHRSRLCPPGTSYALAPGTASGGVLKSALNSAWLLSPGELPNCPTARYRGYRSQVNTLQASL
jgi:hypothetical protein